MRHRENRLGLRDSGPAGDPAPVPADFRGRLAKKYSVSVGRRGKNYDRGTYFDIIVVNLKRVTSAWIDASRTSIPKLNRRYLLRYCLSVSQRFVHAYIIMLSYYPFLEFLGPVGLYSRFFMVFVPVLLHAKVGQIFECWFAAQDKITSVGM